MKNNSSGTGATLTSTKLNFKGVEFGEGVLMSLHGPPGCASVFIWLAYDDKRTQPSELPSPDPPDACHRYPSVSTAHTYYYLIHGASQGASAKSSHLNPPCPPRSPSSKRNSWNRPSSLMAPCTTQPAPPRGSAVAKLRPSRLQAGWSG